MNETTYIVTLKDDRGETGWLNLAESKVSWGGNDGLVIARVVTERPQHLEDAMDRDDNVIRYREE